MTARSTQPKASQSPAAIARKLAKDLGIRASGVTVAADGSVTIFDSATPASLKVDNDRQKTADDAFEQWQKDQAARV
jgi:hypothetical protein